METRDYVMLGEATFLLLIIVAMMVQSHYRERNQRAEFDDLRWKLSEVSKQIESVGKSELISENTNERTSFRTIPVSSTRP